MIGKRVFARISVSLLVSILVIAHIGFPLVKATGLRFYLQPSENVFSTNVTQVGDCFNVTVWIENPQVSGIAAFNVYMEFNDSIIRPVRWFVPAQDPQYIFYGKSISTLPFPPDPGYVHLIPGIGAVQVATILFPTDHSPSTWSGKLCIFEFNITAVPTGPNTSLTSILDIDFADTFLLDHDGEEIAGAIKENGSYEITTSSLSHDIAITDVLPSNYTARQGDILDIQVNATNFGDCTENFDTTTYADVNIMIIGDETTIGTQTMWLSPKSSTIIHFTWDTSEAPPGNLAISARASTVLGETNTTNNLFINGLVHIEKAIHDLLVSDVRISQSSANQGDIVYIQVDVMNNGSLHENPTVTVYTDINTTVIGDETVIGSQTTALPRQDSTTLYFSWDTSEAPPGNLTISAKAEIVPEETNATNNLFINGVILIIPTINDVAVTDVRPLQRAGYVGDTIPIEVDIQSQCDLITSPNITIYADTDVSVIGDELVIGSQIQTVGRYNKMTTSFDWDTIGTPAGNYMLTAVASPLPNEVDLADNNKADGGVQLLQPIPCPDITITCPTVLTVNPSIFDFNPSYHARIMNIGRVSISSTGFEGSLRAVGSRNGTVRLCVNELDVDVYNFYLPLHGEIQIPLWLMFQPEDHWGIYRGNYTLCLTVCGTHRKQLTILGIDINVCQNGAYTVHNETVTFSWNLTGGSLVYLEAETNLPDGWTYAVDPPIGTLFETPHIISVNITASPDAEEGELGSVTLRAFKNETGQMIWQFVYFASTDNNPPAIESVETPILSPDGSVFFNTTVKDRSGVSNVTLHYRVNGEPWQSIPMQWASGDTFNSTQYVLQQTLSQNPATVQYYVTATDWFGNQTSSSTQTISTMTDIEVTEVSANETLVRPNSINTVNATVLNVTVLNHGTLPLSFVNVALYANSTLLATEPIFNLLNGTPTTLCIRVNTSSLQSSSSYIMAAFADCLPFEVNTTNNVRRMEPILRIAMLGDVNLDGKVDVRDVYKVAKNYGTVKPLGVPPWDPEWGPICDIICDAKIDMKDYYKVCQNYGKWYP